LDTDQDVRLSRKLLREVIQKRKNIDEVLRKYLLETRKAFRIYTLPSKKFAHMIIPNFGGGY